jgi:Sec-independent protein translocase protein TatA
MPFSCTAFISPGGGELIMIMLVLIMLFGAKDAPRVLRNIQKFLDKMQRTAADFRYKMMYGDLHSGTTADEPYDVEADYADEEVFDPESEPEPSEEESGTEPPEPETANREFNS